MNREEFIESIKTEVCDSAVESTIDNLVHPPGRKPGAKLIEQSDFYKHLTVNDKKIVNEIITEAVHESIFGFLCVLDGVRKITERNDTEILELTFSSGSEKMLINDPALEYLHDLFKNT